jgi:hypothetical protein
VLAQQRKSDPDWPCKGTVDPAYARVAEATGGVVMLFKPGELDGAVAATPRFTADSGARQL